MTPVGLPLGKIGMTPEPSTKTPTHAKSSGGNVAEYISIINTD